MAFEYAQEQVENLVDSLFPWYGKARKIQRKAERRSLTTAWKATYGDPKDPEVQRRIEETAKALYARSRGQAARH